MVRQHMEMVQQGRRDKEHISAHLGDTFYRNSCKPRLVLVLSLAAISSLATR